MGFIIVVVLLGLWLYGLKIRDDMYKHSRRSALRALGAHDPAAFPAFCRRRKRTNGAASAGRS